jgi:hypothetical protein
VFERDVNDPSPPIGSPEGPIIFRVLEKVKPETVSYEKIHDKVADDLRQEKALRFAQQLAEKCLEKIQETTFEEGVKVLEGENVRIEVVETDYFKRPGIIGEDSAINVLGEDKQELAKEVFGLKIGESTFTVKGKGQKSCYLVTLVDKKKSDTAEFEKEEESLVKQYLIEKQFAFLSEWESWINKKTQLGKSNI